MPGLAACACCPAKSFSNPTVLVISLPLAGAADHPGLSIAWGTCGHVFHLDCIQRWLKTRSACPLCNRCASAQHNTQDLKTFLCCCSLVHCMPVGLLAQVFSALHIASLLLYA